MKKNNVGRLPLPDVKTHYQVIIIKIVQYWYKEADHWNKIESKIKPHIYRHLIYEKGNIAMN